MIFIFDVLVPIMVAQIMFVLLERVFVYKNNALWIKVLRQTVLRVGFTYCVVFLFHFLMKHYLELSVVLMLGVLVFVGLLFLKSKGGKE